MTYYGANPFKLFLQNTKDRLRGKSHIANARSGFLSPPQGTGKVIWVRAGATPESVLLAAELTASIRQKRLDVRLVLTYEAEYPEILAPRFQNLKKVGFGFGPCDKPSAIERVMQRFTPLGVIIVKESAGPNLGAYLSAHEAIHSIAFQVVADEISDGFECCVPASPVDEQQMKQAGHCRAVLPAMDAMNILTPAQVEPSFGGIVRGSANEAALWWLHGAPVSAVCMLLDSTLTVEVLASHYLVVSAGDRSELDAISQACRQRGRPLLRLSEWDRKAIAVGTVLLADEPKWYPAVAASAQAVHLADADNAVFWQALACGAPVTAASELKILQAWRDKVSVELCDTAPALLLKWQNYLSQPYLARQAGDKTRAQFWQLRRESSTVLEDLLERIYRW